MVVGVGITPELVGGGAQPVTKRAGNPGGPGVQGSGALAELEGVMVGSDCVAAAGDAATASRTGAAGMATAICRRTSPMLMSMRAITASTPCPAVRTPSAAK